MDDKDLEIALDLLLQVPELKSILLDIHLMESHSKTFFIEKLKAELKVMKKYKRI